MRRMCSKCGEVKDWPDTDARCPECRPGASRFVLAAFHPDMQPLLDLFDRRDIPWGTVALNAIWPKAHITRQSSGWPGRRSITWVACCARSWPGSPT